MAVSNNIKVYLRVNVDRDNISDLPNLSKLLVELFGKASTIKPYLYLLQDGGCSGNDKVIEEAIGIKEIFELEKANPSMKIFFKKYHPAKFINSILENKVYNPILRHCGASKNQYIFDFNGCVYKCWHGIGNKEYVCGKIDKSIEFNKMSKSWQDRSVKNIEKCKSCKYRYLCGTGCLAVTHYTVNDEVLKSASCVDYENLINSLVLYSLDETIC